MPLPHSPDNPRTPPPTPSADDSTFISETMVGHIVRESVRRHVPADQVTQEVRAHTAPQLLSEAPAVTTPARPPLWRRLTGFFRRRSS